MWESAEEVRPGTSFSIFQPCEISQEASAHLATLNTRALPFRLQSTSDEGANASPTNLVRAMVLVVKRHC